MTLLVALGWIQSIFRLFITLILSIFRAHHYKQWEWNRQYTNNFHDYVLMTCCYLPFYLLDIWVWGRRTTLAIILSKLCNTLCVNWWVVYSTLMYFYNLKILFHPFWIQNFLVDIKGPALAFLPVLAFEGGTRRNIPKFEVCTQ